jgi:hypothetical protein
MAVFNTASETIRRHWVQFRWMVPAGVAATAIVVAGGVSIYGYASGCASREDATVRVGAMSSELQQAAASGKMSVETLAGNVRRMNELATAYESSGDHRGYCDDLEKLRGELALQ